MGEKSPQKAPFGSVSLQSKDLEELLNTIDNLRSQGISHYVDLPQLIVCGDQSSGKSSVLEAVSGIRFPTKDNLCTRFATELILRRSTETNLTVTIVPDRDRPVNEKTNLSDFNPSIPDLDSFPSVVELAMDAMGLKGNKKAFSKDILRVELSGPTQPHLTLVDLPGLFSASSKTQSDEDALLVREMVLSYMKKTRSIILAIVSAKNDFANQVVTKHARDMDPVGQRTLGIITKPDTLYSGSESEKQYVELAENKDVDFRLGWHVLRNRDYETRDCTAAERDDIEEAFFSQGIWKSLSRTKVGISSLKPRLSSVLRDQILFELPSLIREVEYGINDSQTILDKLGSSRATIQQQRLYLLRASQAFYSLSKAGIDGIYTDPFFGDAKTDEGYSKRLRAVTQNNLLEFADDMRKKGHEQEIVDEPSKFRSNSQIVQILRSDFIDEVNNQMKRSRGCELPGTYNPQIIGDLFFQQARPWKGLIECCTTKLLEGARAAILMVLEHTADDATSDKLLRQIINPGLDSLTQGLRHRVSEILEPHQRGHPITYNHYLIDNIQKSREERFKERISRKLNLFFGVAAGAKSTKVYPRDFDVKDLEEALVQGPKMDLDHYACSEAIDCMEAYYKVASKILVDNFGVLAVEIFLQKLPAILSPEVVIALDDEVTESIAGESTESKQERIRVTEKLRILSSSLETLKGLERHRPFVTAAAHPKESGSEPSSPSTNSEEALYAEERYEREESTAEQKPLQDGVEQSRWSELGRPSAKAIPRVESVA